MLRTVRRRSGLRQAELARRAGLPRSVLNAYEHGRRQPGADALAAVVAAAGFELRLVRTAGIAGLTDADHAEVFSQVIELAESLPFRPRPRLGYPPFCDRVK